MPSSKGLRLSVVAALTILMALVGIGTAQMSNANAGRNVMRLTRGEKAVPQKATAANIVQPKLLMASTAAVPTAVPVRTAASEYKSTDALLNMVPAEVLACFRINSLEKGLTDMDNYIMLANPTPMPISVNALVKMQLGKILASPMLTGVDMASSSALLLLPGKGEDRDPMPVFLIAVTSFDEFTSSNSNYKKNDQGVWEIFSPGSTTSKSIFLPATNSKYTILMPTEFTESIKEVAGKINSAKAQGTSLAANIDKAEDELATKETIWAYANIKQLRNLYAEEIEMQIVEMENEMSHIDSAEMANMPFDPGEMMTAYINFYSKLLNESNYASITLTPSPEVLKLKAGFAAVEGTELAKMLTESKIAPTTHTAELLSDDHAVNMLLRGDSELAAAIGQAYADIFKGTKFGEMFDKMMANQSEAMKAVGGEQAAAFSFVPGTPPFAVEQITTLKDIDAYEAAMVGQMKSLSEFYEKMGMPIKIVENADTTEKYNGATIRSYILKPQIPDTDSATDIQQMQAEMIKSIYSIYGDKMEIKMAFCKDKAIVLLGSDSDRKMHTMIDRITSNTLSMPGDLKKAMAMLDNSESANFIGSINMMKIMAGVGQMLELLPMPLPINGEMFKVFDTPTQSCLAASARIGNGKVNAQLALPGDHVKEFAGAIMMFQQQMMMQQAQSQPDMTIKWTCSMHPQVNHDKPGKCPLCGMDLIIPDSTSEPKEMPEPDKSNI